MELLLHNPNNLSNERSLVIKSLKYLIYKFSEKFQKSSKLISSKDGSSGKTNPLNSSMVKTI